MNKIVACAFLLSSSYAFASANDEFGGDLWLLPKDAGRFVFVDAQNRVPEPAVVEVVEKLKDDLCVDIRYVRGTAPDVREVRNALATLGAKGAMWIVDDANLPRVLAACEDGWAYLNVAQLSDGGGEKLLAERFVKEANRTFGFIHGTSDPTMMPACVMKPAVGVEGLDQLVCREYSPMTATKISSYMTDMGYKKANVGTYYDACEEGWAPAPTNDVQKAIWDKVHQLPTKPIKILPPSKQKK